METLTQPLIRQYTKDRAELEVQMCKDLYEIFNGDPIISEIRETIAFAFENIVAGVILPGRSKGAIDEAVKEGKILQVFVKHGGGQPTAADLGDKCKKIIDKWKSWDAADCSDLSRLMGSVLEKAGGVGADAHTEFQKAYSTYKPDEFYKNDPSKAGRSRTADVGYTAAPGGLHTKTGRNAGLDLRIKSYDGNKELGSGISPFKLMPHSTVRKIDIAFGLPEGADISGTTSDSIIVNQLVARFCAALQTSSTSTSKLLQLLPLVTMISHGHHTLLESALTLTLFGVCSYQVGFYTSLLSAGTDDTGKFDTSGQILTVLKRYEQDKRNRHILCWYDVRSQSYTGTWYNFPTEEKEFRRIATTGEGFLRFFRDNVHDLVFENDLKPLTTGSRWAPKRVVI